MTNFLPQWPEMLGNALRVGVVLLLAIIAIRLLRSFTNRLIKRATGDTASRNLRMHEQQTKTVAGLMYSAGVFAILLIALLTVLDVFHFNIVPIAGAAGLASLGIGIGAQGLVKDVINGFFIVFEDQFVVGDLIKVGDTLGRVEHMTLRRTVLRTPQGAIVTIPNGQIQQVANLSRDWSQMFLNIDLNPGQAVEPALAALDAVCGEFRADATWSAALVDGPRVLGVDAIGRTGATLLVQLKTAPLRQDDVARELRRRVSARFETDGIFVAPEHRIALRYSDIGAIPESIAAQPEALKP
jgi:moderate conductance mechanosensitive channel